MKKLLLITLISFFSSVGVSGQSRTAPATDGNPIVRLYPNPATTTITLDFQKAYEKGYSIRIFSFLGRKMYESNNVNQRTTINLSEYNRGVYVYQLFDATGKMVESGKFQVSK